ncbi:zinc finger MYM-type protein 1-like [Chenopodium quinoa]|uniref:zinc finger MYM-type protein 1-like n=1 Tax=Chenopodium quinoa TaxID=63459 RepID=UPI000B798874|nr:zinc finger MYM-type protein 1-like [Chenopodium quinoa]
MPPQNAKYTSPAIQKEILQVFANKVQKEIREEIGDSKYYIIVDGSRDISKREQMAIVLRFADKDGYLRERFFELVHVKDTTSKTLREEISMVLSNHELSIQNLIGQGYDGASNMRGEWNCLKALFMEECRYAYYLFLASKCHDELQASQIAELDNLIEIEEIETAKGLNQIGTLQRPGDTRWSSHYKSIYSLLKMYNATRSVLEKIGIDHRVSYSKRGDAQSALQKLVAFDFVFILLLMEDRMGYTDGLCRALQHKSQDILNAMHLVVGIKSLIQNYRDNGWESLLQKVQSFCLKHDTQVLDMKVAYSEIIRSRRSKYTIIVEHRYRVDVFNAAVDQQLQYLNSLFSERTSALLTLSASLSPIDGYKHFNAENICLLGGIFRV